MLMSLSGCWKKKQKAELKTDKEVTKVQQNKHEIEIPVADNEIRSFFDEDIGEFALANEVANAHEVAKASDIAQDDFSWIDETQDTGFKVVYFDFDQYSVREDQKSALEHNIAIATKAYADAKAAGKTVTIVIDGHACHSAGSHAYNLALSEKRAKVLANECVAAGIAQECVKVVARGDEFPAIINGKTVEGDRAHQSANRRDELRILYS